MWGLIHSDKKICCRFKKINYDFSKKTANYRGVRFESYVCVFFFLVFIALFSFKTFFLHLLFALSAKERLAITFEVYRMKNWIKRISLDKIRTRDPWHAELMLCHYSIWSWQKNFQKIYSHLSIIYWSTRLNKRPTLSIL